MVSKRSPSLTTPRRLSPPTLGRGHQLPHFVVSTIDGGRVDYAEIRDRHHLVLVTLADGGGSAYRQWLDRHMRSIRALDGRCVVTADAIPGVPRPGAIVADRWGEIVLAARATSADDLPDPGELVEWLQCAAAFGPESEDARPG